MAKAPAKISFGKSDFVETGLQTDFFGKVTKSRFRAWDYDGKMDEHRLFLYMEIEPDDDSEYAGTTIENYWSVGSLEMFLPSNDGINPVDLEEGEEGTCLIANPEWLKEHKDIVASAKAKGKSAPSLSKSTNFAFLISELAAAGAEAEGIDDAESLEGLYGFWERKSLKRKMRGGEDEKGEKTDKKSKDSEVLCLTKLKKSTAKTGIGKPAAANRDEDEHSTDIETEIENAIIRIVKKKKAIKMSALAATVAAEYQKGDRKVAMQIATDKKALKALGLAVAKDETVTLPDEDEDQTPAVVKPKVGSKKTAPVEDEDEDEDEEDTEEEDEDDDE